MEVDKQEVHVFPNPASNQLRIFCNWDNYQYELIDNTGRKLLDGNVNNGIKNITIETANFTSGLYYLNI